MKAQINAKGVLSISPETPLEAFAMNAWVKANVGMCKVHDSGATTFEVSNLIFELWDIVQSEVRATFYWKAPEVAK